MIKRFLGALFALTLPVYSAYAADAYMEYYPDSLSMSGATTANTFSIDEATTAATTLTGDYLSAIGHCREAATITNLCLRGGTRTGTPPHYRISLQGVNGSGLPDGTIKTSVSSVFQPPADGTWDGAIKCTGDSGFAALGASYSCAQGEQIAIVVEDDPATSDTIDTSNRLTFTSYWSNSYNDNVYTYAYRHDNNSGSPTNTRNNGVPSLFYRSASKTYWYPIKTGSLVTYSDATSPDERGIHVNISCSYVSTFTVDGLWWWGKVPATGSTVSVVSYSGTAASPSVAAGPDAIDTDGTSDATNNNAQAGFFTTTPTYNCGTDYWFMVRAGTSAAMSIGDISVNTPNDLTAFPGGTQFYAATRDNAAGAITETTTTRPDMKLIIGTWTLPAASGSTISPGTFNRGL